MPEQSTKEFARDGQPALPSAHGSAVAEAFLLMTPGGVCWAGVIEGPRWPKGRKLWGRKYDAQNGRCAICGAPTPPEKMTQDHIIPRSKCGGTQWDNIQLACEPCNAAKGNTFPQNA